MYLVTNADKWVLTAASLSWCWFGSRATAALILLLLFSYSVTRYKHYERWATANDFPVENVVNDGSTTLEDRLGAVADLQLVIRSRKLQDDIMVVRWICPLCVWSRNWLHFIVLTGCIRLEPNCRAMRIFFLCKQIAGDMLCADQNFDIAQVIRFFRSKVRFITLKSVHQNMYQTLKKNAVHSSVFKTSHGSTHGIWDYSEWKTLVAHRRPKNLLFMAFFVEVKSWETCSSPSFCVCAAAWRADHILRAGGKWEEQLQGHRGGLPWHPQVRRSFSL